MIGVDVDAVSLSRAEVGAMPMFTVPGGKHNQRNEIVEVFPAETEYGTYVEPFAGAASVFFKLADDRDDDTAVVLNDFNEDLIRFYRCFRDLDPEEIDCDLSPDEDRIERLRETGFDSDDCRDHVCDFLYVQKRSFGGQGFGSFSTYSATDNANRCDDSPPSTCGASHLLENVEKYQQLLDDTTLQRWDFRTAIDKYDSPDTLFYVDPPYSDDVSCVYEDMSEPVGEKNPALCGPSPEDVRDALAGVDGRWVLSYDATDEVAAVFEDYHIMDLETRRTMPKESNTTDADEFIITNFDPDEVAGQAATGQAAPPVGCPEVWDRAAEHGLIEDAQIAWAISTETQTEVGKRACTAGEADMTVSTSPTLGFFADCPPGGDPVGDVHTHPESGGGVREFSDLDVPSMVGRLADKPERDPVSCVVHPGDDGPMLRCAAPDSVSPVVERELGQAWDAYQAGDETALSAAATTIDRAREELTVCAAPLAELAEIDPAPAPPPAPDLAPAPRTPGVGD